MSEIPYRIIRSNRRTIALYILSEGTVEVRCPKAVTDKQIDTFVAKKERWIRKKLQGMPAPDEKLSEDMLRCLKKQAEERISARLSYYAPIVGVSYGRVTIRRQKTRWGSCSAKGNLNFNCLLALVPPEVLDYVVVHELCHRKIMNHSPRFWEAIERILPNYNASRRWLKENGKRLIAKLP